MLTNPRHAFRGQSSSPTIIPFHMLGSFLLVWNSNSVFKMAAMAIFDFRMSWPWNVGQIFWRQSRSLKVVPFDRLDMVSYYCSIVTLSLKRTISEIFDFEKCRDLEIRVKGHSRSLEMSPFDRVHTTSYWHSIVTTAQTRVVSEIFNVENVVTLKSGSKCHSRSSEVSRSATYDFLLTFHSNHAWAYLAPFPR